MPIYKNVSRVIAFQSLTTAGAANTATTPTCVVSKDGAAQASATNSPSHLGGGHWSITLTAGEMNADLVVLVATGASLVPAQVTIFPESDYTSGRASLISNIDVVLSTRLAASAYTAPPAANVIGAAVWADSSGAGVVTATNRIPSNPAAVGSAMQLDLSQAVASANVSSATSANVGTCLLAAWVEGAGAESVVSTNYTKKNPDGTPFRVFGLDSPTNPTARS